MRGPQKATTSPHNTSRAVERPSP